MSHIKTNIAQLEHMAPVILNSAQRKPLVLVGMVTIGILGVLIDAVFRRINNVFAWSN